VQPLAVEHRGHRVHHGLQDHSGANLVLADNELGVLEFGGVCGPECGEEAREVYAALGDKCRGDRGGIVGAEDVDARVAVAPFGDDHLHRDRALDAVVEAVGRELG
jgi:hypothetical protein